MLGNLKLIYCFKLFFPFLQKHFAKCPTLLYNITEYKKKIAHYISDYFYKNTFFPCQRQHFHRENLCILN